GRGGVRGGCARVAVVDVLVEAKGASGVDELTLALEVDEARCEPFGRVELETELLGLEHERIAVAELRLRWVRRDECVAAEAAGRHIACHERGEAAGRAEKLGLRRRRGGGGRPRRC